MTTLIILDSEERYFPSNIKYLKRAYTLSNDIFLWVQYTFHILPKIQKFKRHKRMTHVVAADIRTQKILKRKKIEFSTLEDFVNHEDFLSYEKKALAFMHELNQKHPDIDHKHKNISLWEMSKSDTYYAFMKEIIINCESILSTLQNINPSKLVVLDTSSRLGKIQKYCSQHIKIIVHDSTISRIKSFILKKGMPLALKTIHTKFLSVLKKGTYKPEKSKKVVFFDVKRGFIFSEPFLKKMAKDVTVLQKKIYKEDN